jgi:glyceraldehyde-3-phosphate dehydrogenase (NADP+)
MDGSNHSSFSTISSTAEYAPILGSVPLMGEAEAAEVVLSASTAFNNGQGLWPTMKVTDRIKCVEICQANESYSARCCQIIDVGNRKIIRRFRKEFDRTVV